MKQFLLLVSLAVFVSTHVTAQQKQIFSKNDIALNGYDVVAYFTESKPVKGNEEYSVNWKESKWLFSTKEHAAMFKANPDKYAPQYGGYCAYGCSRGYKAKTEPDAWSILNGKLYLNYNLQVRDVWSKNTDNYIRKADTAWLSIQDEAMKQ